MPEYKDQLANQSSERMRVLLVSHTCQSRTEGQPKAEILASRPDIDLKVLVPNRWRHYGKWRPADVPVDSDTFDVRKVALPWTGPALFYLHFYPGLTNLIRRFRPHVIDLWEEPWGLVSAQTCWIRNRFLPDARIISETEQNINRSLPPPFEFFRSYTLRNADFLIGRSSQAVKVAQKKGYTGPACTVPNAVDDQLFRPLDRDLCRRQLGWPTDRFICGYVGRMVERKGIADLLDAVERLPQDVSVACVGNGPFESEIRSRSNEGSLRGRLIQVPGKPLSELPIVMNALDVMVLPSRTVRTWKEQFGRVIIEAHACGVPVIGSDSGAIPEVIENGGAVFQEGNVEKLADALRLMYRDRDFREARGKSGLRQVEDRYTWQRVAEQMAGIYHRCMKSGDETNQSEDINNARTIRSARPVCSAGTD